MGVFLVATGLCFSGLMPGLGMAARAFSRVDQRRLRLAEAKVEELGEGLQLDQVTMDKRSVARDHGMGDLAGACDSAVDQPAKFAWARSRHSPIRCSVQPVAEHAGGGNRPSAPVPAVRQIA